MPNKSVKNAFFYFMIDFREEQKKKGITYANMKEVAEAANPAWRAAHTSVRTKYENRAKSEKSKYNKVDAKFTSTGLPFSEIENRERLTKEGAERELRDIQNFVRQNTFNQKILDEDIFIIDVNTFCETNVGYVFGEFTVLRFNIRDGIKEHFGDLINPSFVPLGYASDIKVGCQELGLEFPDPDNARTDYLKVLADIVDYLKHGDSSTKVLPPLYTMPEKEEQVWDFIMQLCQRAHEDESIFRVYKLDILFFYVVNSLRSRGDEGLPKESLALAMLRKDAFKYTPGLGCEHHEANDKSVECTKSRVKRWAYTILDSCCPVAGVESMPGTHMPHDIDIDAVLTLKEKKQEEWRTKGRAPSSCNSRDTSFDVASTSMQNAWNMNVKRQLQPLRKPTADTLNFQTRTMAPEISQSDFPPLNLGSGRGSGRQNFKKNT